MIEGVTKPFELGGSQLTPEQLRAATTAFLTGMSGLLDRLGLPRLEVMIEGVDWIMPVSVDPKKGVSALAMDGQLHEWTQGENTIVRRHDSRGNRRGLDQEIPAIEKTVGPNATPKERMQALWDRTAEENALGINNQPVDEEEVNALFALLGRATDSRR